MSETSTFQKYAGNFGSYSFLILFVKTDANRAADAYAKATGRQVHRDVAVTTSDETGHAPIGGVAQISDSEWSIIFHYLGHWDDFEAGQMAHAVSADVLVFQAEDTSGAIGCEHIVPGKPMRRLLIESDADTQLEYYEMFDKEPPPHEIVDSYVGLFESLGISTVQPYCKEDRSVIADADDANRIVTFHFVGETPWA